MNTTTDTTKTATPAKDVTAGKALAQATQATQATQAKPARKATKKVAAPLTAKPKKQAIAPAAVEVKAAAPKAAAPKAAAPKAAAKKTDTKKPAVKKQAANPSAASSAKSLKDKKVKVVRDSFTIPKSELLQIAESKKRALGLGVEIKKSELIRAGLQALTGMNDAAFKKVLASVPTIKTGRPAKS
jgi:hypothetical protein